LILFNYGFLGGKTGAAIMGRQDERHGRSSGSKSQEGCEGEAGDHCGFSVIGLRFRSDLRGGSATQRERPVNPAFKNDVDSFFVPLLGRFWRPSSLCSILKTQLFAGFGA
jgi:hypothetical protein